MSDHIIMDREYDLIIVGAGILGSALAASLSSKYKTLLIERDLTEPDRIVGELLQPGGVAALETLGLRHCLEDIDAVRVDGYQCIYHGESVAIPYPEGHTGRSFHHGRFVQNLRKAAQSSPATVIEATVAKVIESETDTVMGVKTIDGRHFFAPLTIIADGCFSKFRKDFVEKKPVTRSNFVALLLDNADIPAPNHGHVILSDISPILVYQISTHDTRMLIDVQGPLPSLSSGKLIPFLNETILPQVPDQLKPAVASAIASGQRIRHMPNSFLPPSTNTRDGVMLLGDAMNMRHPLTGGGMTVALKDVVLLNELLTTKLDDYSALRQVKHTFHWARKTRGSSTINVLAQALYSLFALPQHPDSDPTQLKILQEGCFRYFQLGGVCVSGPVGFLSGITPSPVMLALHFFAVAGYAIYLMFKRSKLLGSAVQSVRVLYCACVVLFPVLVSELQ